MIIFFLLHKAVAILLLCRQISNNPALSSRRSSHLNHPYFCRNANAAFAVYGVFVFTCKHHHKLLSLYYFSHFIPLLTTFLYCNVLNVIIQGISKKLHLFHAFRTKNSPEQGCSTRTHTLVLNMPSFCSDRQHSRKHAVRAVFHRKTNLSDS